MQKLLYDAFGVNCDGLTPLSGGKVNRLWRTGPWAVKVYDTEQVPLSRVEQALGLQARLAEQGLPVPSPRRTRSGALYADSADGPVVVMPLMPGVRRSRGSLNVTEARALGEVLGRLHRVLGQGALVVPPPTASSRWKTFREAATNSSAFDTLILRMADAAEQQPTVDWAAQSTGLCHGDLHLHNLLFDETGKVSAILDFDNAAPGWRGVELMMAWNLCLCADPAEPVLTDAGAAFFAGYRSSGVIPHDAWASLPAAYHCSLLANTWPVGLYYRDPASYRPDWLEILNLRYRVAVWLNTNGAAMAEWLTV